MHIGRGHHKHGTYRIEVHAAEGLRDPRTPEGVSSGVVPPSPRISLGDVAAVMAVCPIELQEDLVQQDPG